MRKILITGATGFLGKYLLEALAGSEYHLSILCRKLPAEKDRTENIQYFEGDIEDPYSLPEAFRGIDIVIHGAALVSVKPNENEKMYAVNVLGTRNVVNAILEAGVKRIIHISSVAAVGGGSNPGSMLDEATIWNGESEGYGFTKYKAELQVYRAAAEGVEIDIVNPAVILAPDTTNRSSGLLMKVARSRLPFALQGIVNIVDARDVADFVQRLLGKAGSGQRYILTGFTLTWRDFFREVSGRIGKTGSYIIVPSTLAIVLTAIQEFFFFILRRQPVVTITAVKMATSGKQYSTQKVRVETGFQFRSASLTLDWICSGS